VSGCAKILVLTYEQADDDMTPLPVTALDVPMALVNVSDEACVWRWQVNPKHLVHLRPQTEGAGRGAACPIENDGGHRHHDAQAALAALADPLER
jgi:hypothetical protein